MKTAASILGVAVVLVVSASMMVAISNTVERGGRLAGGGPRVVVETVPSEVVTWLPNTVLIYQDRVLGQVEAARDLEYLMVRAQLLNAAGDICESSFDHALDLKQGQRWTFEIPAEGCSIDKVLLYAKFF